MENKKNKFNPLDELGDFCWEVGVNTLYSIWDLTPEIIKSKTHRILFISSSFLGIIPIIKFGIMPDHWIIFGFNYFLISGTFRSFAKLRYRKINKQLNHIFNKKIFIINSIDTEKFINRINEISIAYKNNMAKVRSFESSTKLDFFKSTIKVFLKNSIFKVSIQPIKNYILRSAVPIDTISKKKSELSHLFDTNIISITQGTSKKIIVLKTCKQNIKNADKTSDKIQYLLNELGFNIMSVTEEIKDSMTIYTIKTTSEFSKINKKCNHLAFRLGIDNKKVSMKENKGNIQFIINGKSKIYPFIKYIGLPLVKEKTKNMQVPIVIGIDLETGKLVCVDMAKFPHALVMGGTGSGKSTFINVLVQSAMYLRSNIAFLMFDFKKVELSQYKDFKNVHFINNYTDAIKAIAILNNEMNRRLDLFVENEVRDLESYNLKNENLPYLVVIIDEAADINLEATDNQTAELVNKSLNQCINKARATGIIVIYAMQRADSTQIKCAIRDQLMTKIGFKTSSESQKQFIEINELSKMEKGELRLKYEEDEKLIKSLFIDDKKLNTNKVYNLLKKQYSNTIKLSKEYKLYD